MNKLIAVLGIVILTLGLAACGNEDESNEPSENEVNEPSANDDINEADIEALINKEEIPDVIATVNGEDINKDTYVATLENMVATQGMDPNSEETKQMVEMMKEQLVEKIVNERIMIQAAEKEGIEASEEEIDERLLPVTAQFESEEELQEVLDQEGVTMDELRADLERLLTLDKYIEKHTEKEEISEEELKAAYDEFVATTEDSDTPSFEEYKDVIKANLEYEQQEEQISKLVEELREKSEVTIHIS